MINEETIKTIIIEELKQKPDINNWHKINYGNINNFLTCVSLYETFIDALNAM